MKPPIDEETRARNRRSLMIALGLVAFVVLVFVVTITRMGGDVVNRPL
ncbi:MAG: hypothetical protein WCI21_03910 [Alphaproteobacteria bacterium]